MIEAAVTAGLILAGLLLGAVRWRRRRSKRRQRREMKRHLFAVYGTGWRSKGKDS